MFTKNRIMSSYLALAFLCGTGVMPVLAQGAAPMNWEAKQQGAINQDAAYGAINSSQQAALQTREAQIQAQQQQYINQNGNGTLAPQQQKQIDSELRNVNRNLSRDVRHDAIQNNPYGAAAMTQPWQGNYQNQGQWQHPQWQGNYQPQGQAQLQQLQNNYHQQGLGQAEQIGNQEQWQHRGGHHHHEGYGNSVNSFGNTGNGFGNTVNGFGNAGNSFGNAGNGFGSGWRP